MQKLSTGAKDIIKGDFTMGTLTNAMNPIRKDRFRNRFDCFVMQRETVPDKETDLVPRVWSISESRWLRVQHPSQ